MKITVEVETDGVYISDENGEIVMWNIDEITEDPEVGLVIANALKLGYEEGAEALREKIKTPAVQKRINEFEDLVGMTLSSITNDGNEIIFTLNNGDRYRLYHSQSCCEYVYVEDVNGDLDDLVGTPLLVVEEVSNFEEPPLPDGYHDSYTWTFYKMATAKGYVTIRWFGSSNGYYSERVDFGRV